MIPCSPTLFTYWFFPHAKWICNFLCPKQCGGSCRRPWLFPCLFSVPLLSLGCLPFPFRNSWHHHCYLKLKESNMMVKEVSRYILHEFLHSSWLLTSICCRILCLLLYVICCSSLCHGSKMLNTRLCMCMFIQINIIFNVTIPWWYFHSLFLYFYKTHSFWLPVLDLSGIEALSFSELFW